METCLKKIPLDIMLYTYKITFSYNTWKSNQRKTDVRIITHLTYEDAKIAFKEWSKKSRTMSNVEILDMVEINSIKKKYLE